MHSSIEIPRQHSNLREQRILERKVLRNLGSATEFCSLYRVQVCVCWGGSLSELAVLVVEGVGGVEERFLGELRPGWRALVNSRQHTMVWLSLSGYRA